jgi:hypothetical protein
MVQFDIAATDRTPHIQVHSKGGIISFEGESYPEDVATFYGPVVAAITELMTVATEINASFHLIYVNSSSMKALYRVFELIQLKHESQVPVKIDWKFEEDDDVMQELGEDFKDRFPELNFNFKPV